MSISRCLVALQSAVFLLVLGGLAAANASTIAVPGDRPTIQAAIDAAIDGDTILVSAGTYKENINFKGKAIRVASVSGPVVTIIDGNAADSVVIFASKEGISSILDGFTIRNGLSTFSTRGFGDGGGILIEGSSPTITNNTIANNRACDGLGISIINGSPIIKGNTITGNTRVGCSGGIGGGGIEVLLGQGTQILNNIISNNSLGAADGGGISIDVGGDMLISGNFIANNSVTGLSPGTSGGGIVMFNLSSPTMINNVIVGNHADFGGGVFWLVPFGSRPRLINNTIVANDSREGSAVHANSPDGMDLIINNILVAPAGQSALFCNNFNTLNTPIIHSNNVFTPGGGAYGGICVDQTGINHNISADPGFVNAVNRDYHLLSTSLCIDAGDNSAPSLPLIDFDGQPRIQDGKGTGQAIIDMGASSSLPHSTFA